jgi:glycosyltransferase involved in cell wall biosynthesis
MLGGIPQALGRAARPLPGKLGTTLSMSDLIGRNQAMQGRLLAVVDKLVLLTAWAVEAAVANGAPREKLTLNRLGLSHPKFVAKAGPDDQPTRPPIRVGYLGRFESIKGVLDLARAAASLSREIPIRVEFRGPVRTEAERHVVDELERIVANDPRIAVAPAIAHADALKILAGYDVLCCPAHCLEGGPTVAIEAHAVGTPVIGTRIGGLAELVIDRVSGRLVDPGDWRDLAGLLSAMAEDPAGTIDHWRRALPAVRTMDQIAADYLTLYTA